VSESSSRMSFTPREIVGELDRYIIGQDAAKRAVAIALRNRWRRQQLDDELADEISPKNIIMIGPTGVGKTEIARRMARLVRAPFIKVEASKFTEVGYVGRDVESMIRDLTEVSVNLVKAEEQEKIIEKARCSAEERLLDLLDTQVATVGYEIREGDEGEAGRPGANREGLRGRLREGEFDEAWIEMETPDKAFPMVEVFSNQGMEEMDINFRDLFGNMVGKKKKVRRLQVSEAMELLIKQESAKLVDMERVKGEAVERVEQTGIIFLDEIDKIVGRHSEHAGPDVSREGVQRDLLPIIEGSTVTTKHGVVRTDHILFVAAGAFHVSSVSDMIPELQGRFPIRVELSSLGREEFVRILTEPRHSLTLQYKALVATEDVKLELAEDAIAAIAEVAAVVNERTENIGARRLHTVLERLLEDLLFSAPERGGETVRVDASFVHEKLAGIVEDQELSKYIL
jgi:ATP-dependent HslUV protease ATP-binding subunit HslU